MATCRIANEEKCQRSHSVKAKDIKKTTDQNLLKLCMH